MIENLLEWFTDWRHVALLAATLSLLYIAREAAHRLLRTAFLLFAHALGLLGRWVQAIGAGAMARHDKLANRLKEDEAGTRLAFAIVLMAAVGIAGWLNFALLERPMAEVVGDSYRVMGVPLYRLAALAIIVLEIAVGMVLLEALGGTSMFPQLERLCEKPRLRLAIVITLATALVVLACIEATLALTRDEISRLERELMSTLAGAAPSDTARSVGELTRYAQAAFGFIIPFALAFLGFAIETLIRNARVVLQLVVALALQALGFALGFLRRLVLDALAVMLALYDLLIFLPLFIEKLARRGAKP